MFRGFPRFVDWVRKVGGRQIELELSGLDAWRHEPLMAALKELIAFMDGKATEPLPFGPEGPVRWVKRKKGIQFESRVTDLHWPDEAPLFSMRCDELLHHTVGVPPFRKGPWPERRFAEDEAATHAPELACVIRERSALVRRALELCPNDIAFTKPIGNREGIERTRSRYRRAAKTG